MEHQHDRPSTDIDRLLAGGGASVAPPADSSSSASPVHTAIDATIDATIDTAIDTTIDAAIHSANPSVSAKPAPNRKQISNNRFGFFIGIVMLLLGGAFLFDQIGPGTQRSAAVTGKHIEKSRDRHGATHTDYIVEGRDDHGGTFDVNLSKDEYRQASAGDDVAIVRSQLTGRVVRMTGPGWDLGRQTLRVVMFSVVTGLGLVITAWTLLYSFRRVSPNAEPKGRRNQLLVLGSSTCIVLAGVGIWVAIERSNAHLASAAEPLPATTTAVTTATGCAEVRREADLWTSGYVADGVISQDELVVVDRSVQAFVPDCGAATVAATVCDVLRHPTPPSLPVTFDPPTLCAGA